MIKQLLFMLALSGSLTVQAQTEEKPVIKVETSPASEQEEPLVYVDTPAEFPGGRQALMKYLSENLVYPESAIENGLQGKCVLKFVVSKTGTISMVSVQRGVPDCPECDAEAIRVIKAMPAWKPGQMNGKPVASYFNLPITFRLPEPEEPKK